MSDNNEAVVLKVLVLGDAATGKTSIIKRYVHNYFSGHHKSTVGVDFHLKKLTIGDTIVHLQLWDIAGQERFGAIARVYYKDAVGAFLVYDITRPTTFETVSKWKEEIDNKVLLSNGMPIPVVLLGNKCDLDNTEIDSAKLNEYCATKGFAGWFDTSAKLNINIDKAARFLVEKILAHGDVILDKRTVQNSFNPANAPKKAAKSSGCC